VKKSGLLIRTVGIFPLSRRGLPWRGDCSSGARDEPNGLCPPNRSPCSWKAPRPCQDGFKDDTRDCCRCHSLCQNSRALSAAAWPPIPNRQTPEATNRVKVLKLTSCAQRLVAGGQRQPGNNVREVCKFTAGRQKAACQPQISLGAWCEPRQANEARSS
jgi:hypothetical protein